MSNPFRLDHKRALITGGGTGLGLGMSQAIVQAGGKVVITGRREDVLKEACAQLGDHAAYVKHDVNDLESIPHLVWQIEQTIGPIDILINNAGVHLRGHVTEISDKQFQEVLLTHLNGSFSLTRECSKYMLERRSGCILFITSMAALFGLPYVIAYTAAKSALRGMVRGLATELSPHGVRVNSIAPGWIESAMLRKSFENDPQREHKILSRMPMAKIGAPKDIGHAAVFLCSDAAGYITGVDLPVDGGVSIGF